jgi:hypothetical protein
MGNPGKKLRIALPEKQALDLLLKVKPTADMPRQGRVKQNPKRKNRNDLQELRQGTRKR